MTDRLDGLVDVARDLMSEESDESDDDAIELRACSYLVEPFLKLLGYRMIPSMVKPQFKAGWAENNRDRVDYALLNGDGEPMILVEAKGIRTVLKREKHGAQLAEYFANVTSAEVGILTNGIQYQVYLDKDASNVMDREPSFEFDLLNSDELARDTILCLGLTDDGSYDRNGFEEALQEWKIVSRVKPKVMSLFEAWHQGTGDLEGVVVGQLGEPIDGTGRVGEWFRESVDGKRAKSPPETGGVAT